MVVQPGGIFAPAPDLREVLGKRGVNWLWGRSETCGGWLPPLAPVKQPARSLPNCPSIESRRFPLIRLEQPKGRRGGMGYRSAEEADRGYRGWSVHDLHAALLYLRDVDHQRVCGDVVGPVLLLLTVGVAHVAFLAGRVTV